MRTKQLVAAVTALSLACTPTSAWAVDAASDIVDAQPTTPALASAAAKDDLVQEGNSGDIEGGTDSAGRSDADTGTPAGDAGLADEAGTTDDETALDGASGEDVAGSGVGVDGRTGNASQLKGSSAADEAGEPKSLALQAPFAGEVYTSQLEPGRGYELNGDTILIVDSGISLDSLTGPYRLTVQGTETLTVGSINVAELTVSGAVVTTQSLHSPTLNMERGRLDVVATCSVPVVNMSGGIMHTNYEDVSSGITTIDTFHLSGGAYYAYTRLYMDNLTVTDGYFESISGGLDVGSLDVSGGITTIRGGVDDSAAAALLVRGHAELSGGTLHAESIGRSGEGMVAQSVSVRGNELTTIGSTGGLRTEGELIVTDGRVEATGETAVTSGAGISVYEPMAIILPEDGRVADGVGAGSAIVEGDDIATHVVIEPLSFEYVITSGKGTTWQLGNIGYLPFGTNGHVDDLLGVHVNNVELEEGVHYVVDEGSDVNGNGDTGDNVAIQLTDVFLDTLPVDVHDIRVEFERDDAEGYFFVAPAASNGGEDAGDAEDEETDTDASTDEDADTNADSNAGSSTADGLGSGSVSAPQPVGAVRTASVGGGSLPKTGDPALAAGSIVGAGTLFAAIGAALKRRAKKGEHEAL